LLSGIKRAYCQSGDSVRVKIITSGSTKVCDTVTRKRWTHNIFRQGWSYLQKDPNDCNADVDEGVLNARGEEMYKPYEGKIIRYIYLEKLGFERNFSDTSNHIRNFTTRLANVLHHNTRDWVIRNNLY